ncbi:MAG: hypothetical protein SVT52_06620 [Planctomycetota bacterium]|nr:hypothetical protein [Planctomycetota bacterium]
MAATLAWAGIAFFNPIMDKLLEGQAVFVAEKGEKVVDKSKKGV